MNYTNADFEGVVEQKPTRLFTMKNGNGMIVTLTNYGVKIVLIYVPDKNGDYADVVLGFKSLVDYQKFGASHGAIVGPFANRIANACFTIGNDTFHLPVNNGKACLHSGPDSWYRKGWNFMEENNKIVFSIESPDGEFGFPGNKKAIVTYSLSENNELRIDYSVTTDKPCHINMTNHSYFNLHGEGNGDILNHILYINADKYTPVADNSMIPTGEIAEVKGTALDFTSPQAMGILIDSEDPQIAFATGYDFNYVLNRKNKDLILTASALEPESKRFMEVYTTEPGLQFYSGNHLKGNETGKTGKAYSKRTGFCLETQHYPDSPNKPEFPTTLLNPGEEYNSTTIYRFSVKQ